MYANHTDTLENQATAQIKAMAAEKFQGVRVRSYDSGNVSASISTAAKLAHKHEVDYVVFAANIYGRGQFVVGPANRNEMVNSGNIALRQGAPFYRVTPTGELYRRNAV